MVINADDKILKAIRSLYTANPLRLQAEKLLANPSASIEDMKPILRAFSFGRFLRADEHTVAAWLVANTRWSDTKRASLSEKLGELLRNALSGWRSGGVALQWWYALVVTGIIFAIFGGQDHWRSTNYWFGLTAYYTALIILTRHDKYCRLRQTRLLIASICDLGHPNGIEALAGAIRQKYVSEIASFAMAGLVARLKPEHYSTAPANTVPSLCEALPKADVETTLVILRALGIIGDGRAIKDVERLSENSPTPEISQAASELLPILLQREFDRNMQAQLLRASQEGPDERHDLLRAAAGGSEEDPELLLRAVWAEEEKGMGS